MKRLWMWCIVTVCTLLAPLPGIAQDKAKPGQTVEFRLDPKTARLEVDGRPQTVENGVCRLKLSAGAHKYVVTADDYHSKTADFDVEKSSKTLIVDVPLMYSVGWLRLEGSDVAGAEVLVDRKPVDNTSGKPVKLDGGIHTLQINKKYYDLYEDEINIVEGETYELRPEMTAQFARTYINVTGGGAELWMNGEKISDEGTWSGPLENGSYVIEARRPYYETVRETVEITSTGEERRISLRAPVPILGSLHISSTPSGAEVRVDGKKVGKTPVEMPEVLIGSHNIDIYKDGYARQSFSAEVKVGETTRVAPTLSDQETITVTTDPAGANLWVDGRRLDGDSPFSYTGKIGEHDVEVTCYGFDRIKKRMILGKEPRVHFKLKPSIIKPTDFYIGLGMSVGSCMSVDATMGFNVKNVNVEGFYSYGLKESPSIYWMPAGNNPYDYPESDCFRASIIAGGKIGYSFLLGNRLKITPQAGCKFTSFSGNIENLNCMGATVGARVYLAFSRRFGLSVTPEYCFGIMKGDEYKAVSEICPEVKNMAEGFNVKFALVWCL